MLIASIKLQDAATTGNGHALDLRGWGERHTFYISGTGTITAGAIQLETAASADYTGTWSPLGAPITVVSGQDDHYSYDGALKAVRARISTDVAGGGSATVKLVSVE